MLTPLDIENREFRKTMRGYNDQEVDRFMDEVRLDYEKIYKENSDLKLKLEYMKEQLESYINLENSIKDTLIISKKTAEDIHINVVREKELIIKEAQINAKNIISSANNEVIRIQNEYEDIRKEFILFKNKMTTLMGDVSLKSNILDRKFEETQRINIITEDMLDKNN